MCTKCSANWFSSVQDTRVLTNAQLFIYLKIITRFFS